MNGHSTITGLEAFDDHELEDLEMEDYEDFENIEADPFIGGALRKARRLAGRVARLPIPKSVLQRVARAGAGALGTAIAGPGGGALATRIANQALREAAYEGDYESEMEGEAAFEAQFEAVGGDLEALYEMEYYAGLAAEAENEAEADEFIGALAGLAGKVLPKAIPLIGKGVRAAGNLFRRRRPTRRMIRTLPRVAARTAMQMQRRPTSPQRVAGTMAHNLATTMATPARVSGILQRNRLTAQQPGRFGRFPNQASRGQFRRRGRRPRRLLPIYAVVR